MMPHLTEDQLNGSADGSLAASERAAVESHLAACASCRESFELAAEMERALVSRSAQVPPAGAFLPALPAHTTVAHPRLVEIFRTMMSPAGIAIILVVWSTMFAFRFREPVARSLEGLSGRFTAFSDGISSSLLGAASGDAYTLVAVYVVLALVLLGSTGAITLRYLRQS